MLYYVMMNTIKLQHFSYKALIKIKTILLLVNNKYAEQKNIWLELNKANEVKTR